MATNVTIYVPNEGEKEALRAILKTKALVLGLYKNAVIGEGATIFESFTEWPSDGGRAYTRKELSIDLVENGVAADKWFLTTNALGRAEGQYSNAVLSWNFNAIDVADSASVYGVFAFSWFLPFNAGSKEIKVGDTVKGAISGATGPVIGVCLISVLGNWHRSPAAWTLRAKPGPSRTMRTSTLRARSLPWWRPPPQPASLILRGRPVQDPGERMP